MVKVGPKLPPPTRRELARLEKEQKRVEQLENGFNPAVLGEPRERVIYLFRIKKAAHHPKLDDYELEEARRKREKNHRRALARKMAKAPAEADAGQGSMDCTDLSSGVSTIVDDTVPCTTFAEAGVGTALLDWEAIPACVSLAYPDRYLAMDTLAKNPCYDEKISSLSPVLEFGSESKECFDLLTVSVSAAACLDSPMLNMPESDSLCNLGPVYSASSEAPNVANEQGNPPSKIGRTNVQTAKTVLHPNNAARSSVLVFPNKSVQEPRVAAAKFTRSSSNASRNALPTRNTSSKSSIFSEPLDARKYSLKSLSARSSSRSHRSPSLYQFTFQRHISEGNSLKDPVVPNKLFKFPEPTTSSASSLSATSNLRILPGSAAQPVSLPLKAEPIFPTISKGTEGLRGSEYFASSGKPRYVGPSGKALFPHLPNVYETKSEKALFALSQKIKSDDRLSDEIESTRGINLRPLRVNYPRAVVESLQSDKTPTAMPQPGFGDGSIIRPDPREDRADTASGGYSKDDDNFSSNNSTTLGMEERKVKNRADQLGAIRAEINVTNTGNDDPMINLGSTSLAPAASIIQERRPAFDDKFIQQRRGLTVDDLEKGVLDPQTPTRFPRATGGMKCPDSPLDTRSGIVAPVSTPVSRSPLLFAIALPSPPWSRSAILPTHACEANSNTEERGFGGLVLALKWVLKKTLDYFWQRRR